MDVSLASNILESIFDGVYFVDLDRRITFWNKGAEIISGFSKSEVVGKKCSEQLLNHEDESGCILCKSECPLHTCMKNGDTSTAVVYLNHKNGGKIPVDSSDPDGLKTIEPFYLVYAELSKPGNFNIFHGQTGKLKVEMRPEPLFVRIMRSIRQFLQERYKI